MYENFDPSRNIFYITFPSLNFNVTCPKYRKFDTNHIGVSLIMHRKVTRPPPPPPFLKASGFRHSCANRIMELQKHRKCKKMMVRIVYLRVLIISNKKSTFFLEQEMIIFTPDVAYQQYYYGNIKTKCILIRMCIYNWHWESLNASTYNLIEN